MTYYAKWPPWAARLLILVALILIGVAALPHRTLKPPPPPSNTNLFRDGDLYKAIVARVATGEDYYSAAAAEQRAHGYPTSPAPVFRPPWLARLLAALPSSLARTIAVFPLYVVLAGLWYRDLLRSSLAAPWRIAAAVVLLTGIGMVGMGGASYLHEIWAAGLIALSLTIYRADRWALSVALGLAACLIRELALPFLWAMAAFALYERRWRELAAWATATVLACAVLAWHLATANALYRAGDGVSPGWLSFSGLPFVMLTARWNLALLLLPDPLVALAISLGLIGLAGWRDPRARRAALVVGGYMASFAIVGRPDTSNWGQLYAPLLAVGFVLAPAAANDLIRRALSRRPAE